MSGGTGPPPGNEAPGAPSSAQGKPPASPEHKLGRSSRTCYDDTRGVCGGEEQALVRFSASGHVSRYDIGRVHKLGFAVILRGTLLENPFLWVQAFVLVGIAVMLGFIVHYSPVELENMLDVKEKLAELVGDLHRLSAFFLGLFVSLVLSRWSTLRLQVVGTLFGNVCNISTMAGHVFAGTDAHARAMRRRVLRYLLLIFMLTFSEARGENDLSQMEDAGLLMPAERTILESLPRKAQSVAGWLLYHFHSAAEMAGGRWGGKHYERKLLLEQIFKLRGMVGDSHMYVGVQLPLPYVALLTLIVKFTMATATMESAADLAAAHEQGEWVVYGIVILQVLLWSVFYQACLDLHTILSNPFGFDDADFPQSDYFKSMMGACQAQLESETLAKNHLLALTQAKGRAVDAELDTLEGAPDPGAPQLGGRRDSGKLLQSRLFGGKGMLSASPRLKGRRGKIQRAKSVIMS